MAQTGFYIMESGDLCPKLKRPRREADHSPPFSAEVRNCGALTPLSHTSSWRAAQLSRGTFHLRARYVIIYYVNTGIKKAGHQNIY
jgi:hypothetical protein